MTWPHSAHALRQTLLSEPFYRDILYRLHFLLLCKTVLLCLVISVERVGFWLGLYVHGWSSCRSAAMTTLCSVNGLTDLPQLDCSSEIWRPTFRTNHVKRCLRPWLSRDFFKLKSILKNLTWPLLLLLFCSSSFQMWPPYCKSCHSWKPVRKRKTTGRVFRLVSWATVSFLLC